MASMRLRIVWNRQRRMASRASVHLCLPAAWFHSLALRAIPCRNKLRIPFTAKAVIWERKEKHTARNLLLEYSEQLACEIANLCNEYKIDSNTVYQIKKSSSSVFANISEAQYPQSLADMLSKFEIARKECMETESWLKLIYSSGSINEESFKKYRNLCGRIRRMLTSSCITIENKLKQG